MIIATVVGSAVSTMKLDALQSSKLLVVRPADAQGNATGAPFLAVDLVGAGEGELVMISSGSSARMALGAARAGSTARRPTPQSSASSIPCAMTGN